MTNVNTITEKPIQTPNINQLEKDQARSQAHEARMTLIDQYLSGDSSALNKIKQMNKIVNEQGAYMTTDQENQVKLSRQKSQSNYKEALESAGTNPEIVSAIQQLNHQIMGMYDTVLNYKTK